MPDIINTSAITAERARVADVSRIIAQSRGSIPPGILEHLQDRAFQSGWSADTLRDALWEVMTGKGGDVARQMQLPPRTPDPSDPAVIRDAMADAIARRGKHGYEPSSDRHAEFLDMRPAQMAAELLRLRGEPAPSRDPLVIVERALTTTSAFPAVLSPAANAIALHGRPTGTCFDAATSGISDRTAICAPVTSLH